MRTLPHGIRDWWVFLVPGGSLCAQSWRPYYIVLCKKHNKIFLALNFYRLQNDIFIPPKMSFLLLCTVPPTEDMLPSFETTASGKNRRIGMVLLRLPHEMQGWSLVGDKLYRHLIKITGAKFQRCTLGWISVPKIFQDDMNWPIWASYLRLRECLVTWCLFQSSR